MKTLNKVLVEKLAAAQLVEIFSTTYTTKQYITVFT
jgi:hypothetical protein